MILRKFYTLGIFIYFCAGCATWSTDPGRSTDSVASESEKIMTLSIAPEVTELGVQTARGPHQVYWSENHENGRLLITLGGTNSYPSDFRELSQFAVSLGYAVIGVDYQNSIVTTVCRRDLRRDCFDNFREENMFGRNVSDLVQVSPKNGILNRIEKLIFYLAQQDIRWKKYLNNGELRWDLVTVAGHSQGSGHAAYLAKLKGLQRVIMIAGPQDHFEKEPAPWLVRSGATEPGRYYSLLHSLDPYEVIYQKNIFEILSNGHFSEHLLLMSDQTRDPHADLMKIKYIESWRKLFQHLQ